MVEEAEYNCNTCVWEAMRVKAYASKEEQKNPRWQSLSYKRADGLSSLRSVSMSTQ